jgi:hypothetical protein
MARTVDTSSTLENFRQEHNNLANDIGAIGNLRTGDTSSIVNAVNYIMDQYFFFQDFDFDGSDGATSNTVFSGADNIGNTLQYSAGKILVYKNGLLLRNGTDYTASNGTSLTLSSSANNGDVIRVSSYTGSYQNVASGTSGLFDAWQQAGEVIFNKNEGGIVFNADNSITTTPTVSNSFQFDGPSYHNDHVHVNAVSSSPKELRFRDADNSNYVALLAPTTVGTNFSLKLPTADGSSGQLLSTNGSGQLSFVSSATATDVNVSAQNSENSTHFPLFVDGATGTQGAESDSGFTYNPSSGTLTSTTFVGALTGNASTATTLATNRNFSISGDITASTVAFNGSGAVVLSATIDDNVVDASALNISGNGSSGQAILSDGDGSFSYGAGGKTTAEIEDIVGAMLDGTETGISVSYDSTDNNLDFVVGGITTSMITNSQITQAKMAANSVDASIIVDNSVGAAELNVSGNGSSGQILASDGDGTFSWAADSGLSTEQVQDIVGGMLVGTETRIGVTYDDTNGRINFVVDDMTANTTYSVGDGGLTQKNFTTTLFNKLDNIEAGSTPDQSNAEIKAAVEAASDSNTFTDADHSKLNGIAAGATASSGTVDTSGTVNANEFARFTDGNTLSALTYAETRAALNVADGATADQTNVSGTAATVTGGTQASITNCANLVQVGTITTGTWQGTAINQTYLTGQSGTNTGDQSSVSGNAGTVTGTLENSGNTTAHYIPFATGTSTGAKSLKFSTDTAGGDTGLKYVPGEGASNAFGTLYVDRTISKLFYVDADNQLTDTQLKTHRIGVNMSSAGVDGRIDASNDIVAFSSSDMTLKENIIPIPNALDKVLSLGGYTFDWKKEKEKEHGYTGSDIGVLAQEVEDVLPSAVRKNNFGNKAVRYEKLIPLLVQSIKELKSELDDLKSSNS